MEKLISIVFALSLLCFSTNAGAATTKVYVAKLSEDSTNITAAVLENSIGTITYSRIEEGRYRLTCSQCFTDETKIVGLRSFHLVSGGKYYVYWEDEIEITGNSLVIQTYGQSGVLSDNILSWDDFRIEVYPPDI